MAISTIGLWLATNRLWDAGERQLKLLGVSSAAQSRDMQASIEAAKEANRLNRDSFITTQRPWINVDVIPRGIAYDVNGLRIDARFVVTNSGNSPATHVNIFPEVIAPDLSDIPKQGSNFDPRGAMHSLIESRRNSFPSPWGATVQPDLNRPLIQDINIGSFRREDLDRMTAQFEAIYPVLIVVIEYRFVFDSAFHFTALGLDVWRIGAPHKEGWAPNLIVPAMGDLPADQVQFRKSFITGEYAD